MKKPDKIVFDLDPSNNGKILIVKAAKALKEFLDNIGLDSYLMTTVSRGLHVVVPIIPEMNFDDVRSYALQIAESVAKKEPDNFTIEQRKDKRKNRVFIDYLRNSYAQISVAPYSIRSIAVAPVATPLDWDELTYKSFDPQKYNMKNIFRRLGKKMILGKIFILMLHF